MKSFTGYKAEKSANFDTLPVGAYVCGIKDVKIESYDWGEKMAIAFDITEGDHKGFYTDQYKSNTAEDKKYKGVWRISVPDENSEYFENQKRTFNNLMFCIEDSNPGYSWDWDEKKLKGKKLGILFRSEEWEFGDRSGWRTAPFKALTVADVQSGNFKIPKEKPLNDKKTETKKPSMSVIEDGDDVPW